MHTKKKKKKVVKLYSLLTVKIFHIHTLCSMLLFPVLASLIRYIREYFENPSAFICHDETNAYAETVCRPSKWARLFKSDFSIRFY